jgi:hypothetical protein
LPPDRATLPAPFRFASQKHPLAFYSASQNAPFAFKRAYNAYLEKVCKNAYIFAIIPEVTVSNGQTGLAIGPDWGVQDKVS